MKERTKDMHNQVDAAQTIYRMRSNGITDAQIAAHIFLGCTSFDLDLDALPASEFPYCHECLSQALDGMDTETEACEVLHGLMERLREVHCSRCSHPWDSHDRTRPDQPCVNRLPSACPCHGFERAAPDFSEPTFTVPGPLETERPGARVGPAVSAHDDRWPR